MRLLDAKSVETQFLHIFFLCDCSGSMAGQRMATINLAIDKSLQKVLAYQEYVPHIQFYFSAICFSNTAKWHVLNSPLNNTHYQWPQITEAGGMTALGAAFKLLSQQLKQQVAKQNTIKPIVLLLTDGKPTDDANSALLNMQQQISNQHIPIYAIGIGDEVNYETLTNIVGNKEEHMVITNQTPKIIRCILEFIFANLKSI